MNELSAVAHAVAALTGGRVVLEDVDGVVLAEVCDHPAPAPAPDPAPGPVPGAVGAAVHRDGRYVGAIRVHPAAAPLADDAERVVQDAARVAARYFTPPGADAARDRVLDVLLAGGGEPETAAGYLGVAPDGSFAVVAFAGGDTARLARLVSTSWRAFRGEAWCTVTGDVVHLLAPLPAGTGAGRLLETARRVAADAERALRRPVRGGVGPAGPLAEAGMSRRVADEVLRAAASRTGGPAVADLDEARTDVVLLALRDAAARRPELFRGSVAPLAAHDAENGTAYVETLRAYLDAFGSAAEAAARMCVHVRTLRYRLRRIAELSGIRLDDPEQRLAVQLELRLTEA